jgi:hypothetical protein
MTKEDGRLSEDIGILKMNMNGLILLTAITTKKVNGLKIKDSPPLLLLVILISWFRYFVCKLFK